jgi:anthranilate synthase/aminodeoxychorismate synthase-like glutamine amidotransferase
MLLMIDNYDSFTYNLVQYFFELGQKVEVFRNDQISLQEIEKKSPDFLVISPGPCTPKEAGISVNAISHFAGKIPILGVCLGHQSIGAAYGAKIIKANTIMHGKLSKISHNQSGVFSSIENNFTATRYHSLVIDEDSLSEDFEVSARSDDGTLMAIQHNVFPVTGIQFHPESIATENGKALLKNFLEGK